MEADDRLLRWGAAVYAFGLAVHTADHLRRGLDVITHHVFWLGNLSTVLGLIAVLAVLARHRLAPLLAVSFGAPIALGVSAVHLLPTWSTALSDSFPSGHAIWISYTVVLIEIAGAFAMSVAGVRILRREGLASVAIAR